MRAECDKSFDQVHQRNKCHYPGHGPGSSTNHGMMTATHNLASLAGSQSCLPFDLAMKTVFSPELNGLGRCMPYN